MHPLVPALSGLLLLATATAPGPLQAQERGSGIQRCERPDGTRVYTDQDCTVFSATPAPVEGELLMRLASDGGGDAPAPLAAIASHVSPSPAEVPIPLARDNAAPPSPLPRTTGRGCAHSPTQLVMDLRAAWSEGDVNRIAASYHWAGSGTREATSVMARLQSLAALPLQDIRHYGTGGGLARLAGRGAAASAERLHVVLGDGGRTRVHDFRLTPHQGCYFIRF
ncbi:hypothetical protein LY625_04740 [Lysobacter sp. GX 14042]|uniref:hypothetical protein n=1 Tax=Lysobacter sp. GX 14042 TaxID=2907155 RepID=UPI001F2451D3|nr:hypothetical protein [Lysobacter sp. GX 14042]MCE7031930.1 hypothetical protein [Lysobacter sp. GX 14042]